MNIKHPTRGVKIERHTSVHNPTAEDGRGLKGSREAAPPVGGAGKEWIP